MLKPGKMKIEPKDENMDYCTDNKDPLDSYHFTDHEEDSDSTCSFISEDGSDEDDADSEDYEWTDIDADPAIHTFTGEEGLKVKISKNASKWDTFSLLFDDSLIEKIVFWTNSRASFLLATRGTLPESNSKQWTLVSVDEMKQFLGLCIVIGNISMPALDLYWSKNVLYNHPLFRKVMAENRFSSILSCLCFCEEMDNSHGLIKIERVLTHLLQNIQNAYYPGENLLLDEAMILKRHLTYNQDGILKHSIKMCELCSADGFVMNIRICNGEESVKHSTSVIHEVMKNYVGKGRTVYLGRFYNSIELATSLYEKKTHVVGPLSRKAKGNPKYLMQENLKRGETIFARKENILIQKWKDKGNLLIISTKHKATLEETSGEKMVPEAIVACKKYKSNTYRCRQMVEYYSAPRKSLPWYLQIFFHLFDVAIWNGCLLYNKIRSTKSYLEYREEIALNLLSNGNGELFSASVEKVSIQHFPKKLVKRLRCRVCARKKQRTVTWYTCDICKTNNGEPIGLCVIECFRIYHNGR